MNYLYRANVFFVICTALISCRSELYSNAKISKTTKNNSNKNPIIDNIIDIKDFKKLIRTKTNVLVCFYTDHKEATPVIKLMNQVAANIKGEGVMVLVDCSKEAKKMCKKLKVPTSINEKPASEATYLLKHYKDGEFHKDYDRQLTVNSMTNFMRDPTGDIPWEEDPTANHVVHLSDGNSLLKLLRKESRPVLVMFYAPWCGFCKTLKPEYAEAATELQGHSVLAAIDVNRPENTDLRHQYNISGFPTLQYFLNGRKRFQYEGENKKAALVEFMHNPKSNAAQGKPKQAEEPDWSETDNEIVHLTAASFDPVMKEEASVLVMFYAPWCGHCKRMKPEYEAAAAKMKQQNIPGMLAALDATKESSIASRYSVKGYPTLKYFSYGQVKFDVNVREADKILEFMKDPKEPPPPPPPEKSWSDDATLSPNVRHLTEEDFKPFLRKKKHVLVIFYAPWCGHCKRAKPEFSRAADRFADDPKVEFAAVDCTTQQALCSANDIKGYPTIKYFSYYTHSRKMYSGGRTEEEFVAFMMNANSDATKTNELKIEPVGGGRHCQELTSNTFHSAVQSRPVVLVLFYASWCPHCKTLMPQWQQAAQELNDLGLNGTLVMIDGSEHADIADEYNIEGFPTIKLFKNGKMDGVYKGGKKSHEIVDYIVKQTGFDKIRNRKKKDEL